MAFGFGTFVMLVVIVVVVILLMTTASGGGKPGQRAQRGCPHCGAVHPHFAQFCRRCGKRMA